MRLREIQQILREHLPIPLDPVSFSAASGAKAFRITRRAQIQLSLRELSDIPVLQSAATAVLSSTFFADPPESDTVTVLQPTYDEARSHIEYLNTRGKDLLEILNATLGPEPDNLISIRLMNGVEDAAALIGAVDDIRKVTDDALSLLGESHTAFYGFDRGSQWIELVSSPLGVTILASLYYAANRVVADILRHKAQMKDLESADLENEERKQIIETHKILNKKLRRSEAKRITSISKVEANNETVGKLTVCIERMAKLIMRGAELRLALKAPPDAREQEVTVKALRRTVLKELGGQSIPQLSESTSVDAANEDGSSPEIPRGDESQGKAK